MPSRPAAPSRAAAIAPAPAEKPSIETRASWVVAVATLAILSVSFAAPYVAAVALKPIADELGGARSVPALAGALSYLGAGLGGIAMGWAAERIGVRWTVMFGAVMIGVGLAISTGGEAWHLYVGHGLFIGLLGNAGIFPPLMTYVSHWFDRRRGTALALISSGQYMAGALWPPIFERAVAWVGWRQTMLLFGLFSIAVIVPLAAIFLRPPPAPVAAVAGTGGVGEHSSSRLGKSATFALLCVASLLCCVPMAIPMGHLVAFCTDLGMAPARGALMLSVLLGTAFLARQFWGWVADRIGGLRTLLAGSVCQAAALTGFLLTQDEFGLFAVSTAFGLGFAGLIPAYIVAIRELFPAAEASWRVPTLLFLSLIGMALGGWGAGVVYDYFGYYAPAFAMGVVSNLVHFAIIAALVTGDRRPSPGGAFSTTSTVYPQAKPL